MKQNGTLIAVTKEYFTQNILASKYRGIYGFIIYCLNFFFYYYFRIFITMGKSSYQATNWIYTDYKTT